MKYIIVNKIVEFISYPYSFLMNDNKVKFLSNLIDKRYMQAKENFFIEKVNEFQLIIKKMV
jgi:hypothetical protein